eukprot:CAMPEP_0171493558 /NCGR_PEP_ID=MMETSP0958-20121227/5029_1 /TAXON_ID=87120 /ORGANISM="Aurantiochytrium limacinum, Strain ATCCMYA-1381" /LENGTH=351 /DNA_ID=CAMNT_0012027195 /DNA_START=92 /DNA_END=1144 /DNA_ORIENTATION=-
MEDIGHVRLDSGLPEGELAEHDGGLVIAQFTDLHHFPLGVKHFEARGRTIDFDKEGYSSEQSLALMKHVLKEATPDLCILTGDIIDGRPCQGMDRGAFKDVMMEVLQPILEANIPWTFTPGNHDDDHSPWSREDLLEIYKLPLCVSAKATSFNHTFTIGRKDQPDATNSLRLWLFDSGANSDDPNIMYTTFSKETVNGYKQLSQSGKLAPSADGLAFFHIPLPEYNGLTPLAGKNGLFDAALMGEKVPFPFNHEPLTSLVRLLGKDKVVGSSKLNSGLFDAMKEQGNILATFCGHDHHSDFVARRDNIYLCYGRCGSYTPPHDWEGAGGPLPFDKGARLIEFKGHDKVFTW